jgi:hypothetical protein
MDVENLAKELILKNMTPEQQMAVLDSVRSSVAQAKEVQKRKIGENVDLVVQALKKIESDIRSRFDDVGNSIEKRVASIKDGRDGINGKDGRDGKDGRSGKDGAKGDRGDAGRDGRDGVDGTDGVSVTAARIDFDGSLVITLSSGRELNVGEVVTPDLAERIKVITNGGGTSQSVLDTLDSLQAQINAISIPSQTGNSGKFLTTNGTALSWGSVAGVLTYQGTWNATTNTPTLTSSVGTSGYYYVVATAGSTDLNGITDWQIGDWLIFNGSAWQKIDQTNLVVSVAGRTGAVTLSNTDISGLGTMSTQNASSVAITGGTATLTSLTTPTVQATNSGGLSLKNSAGTTQLSMGGGGGDNLSLLVSTNINGTNAQIDISPTGTGHVHIKPTGVNSIEIAPTYVGEIENMTIGAVTPKSGTFTTLTATGTTTLANGAILGTPASGNLANCTFPTLNQNTTGSAATLTTARAIYGNNFDGSAALTQVIASTYGGTGNGFTKFTGATTAERTYTLPDASSTIVVQGGALGTPSSGTVTNLTGTASININGTVGATTPAAGTFTSLSDSGNLTFTGTGNRITGDFSNATIANRVAFQTSTSNGNTILEVIPNGTGNSTSILCETDAGLVNTSFAQVLAATTEISFRSGIRGTGTYQPMTFHTGGSERIRVDTSGNVGIGISPATKLDVLGTIWSRSGGSSGAVAALSSDATSGANGITLEATFTTGGYGPIKFKTNNAESMRINSSGNVGIGTNSPTTKLTVGSIAAGTIEATYKGNIRIEGTETTIESQGGLEFKMTSDGYGAKIQTISSGGTNLAFATRNNSATWTERMRIDPSGNVGIGVVPSAWSSTKAIEVGSLGTALWSSGAGSTSLSAGAYYNSGWKYANSTTKPAIIDWDTAGKINTFTATATGTAGNAITFVTGPFVANGGISWTNGSSDARLKKNFEISQGLTELLQIEPVKFHFDWEEDGAPKRLGFKAQNLLPLIPEMVVEKEDKAEDGTPYLTITPDYILPVLVKAIQEQQALITTLTDRITALEQA